MPSFARDIRPLFRDKDVDDMRFALDLTQHHDVKTNASGMYDRLLDGSMPCDGADDQILLFSQSIQKGYSP